MRDREYHDTSRATALISLHAMTEYLLNEGGTVEHERRLESKARIGCVAVSKYVSYLSAENNRELVQLAKARASIDAPSGREIPAPQDSKVA